MKTDIRKKLQPLEVLDINKCKTVGSTVEQMEKCAIGARMIGEVSKSLCELVASGEKVFVVYDGKAETELGKLLVKMVKGKKWFAGVLAPEEIAQNKSVKNTTLLVVGNFSERYEEAIFKKTKRTIFINQNNLFKPGQVRDGYFPDFIHADPKLVIPVIYLVLEERIGKTPAGTADLIEMWSKFEGAATQAAHGFETLRQMIEDPDCTVIATISGIMTMAKMGGLISHMIDKSWVQVIAATGALIGHGFVEGVGLKHFKYNPAFDDVMMAKQKLNRITDTVEPEENLDHVEEIFSHVLGKKLADGGIVSPSRVNFLIGEHIAKNYPGETSILRSAYEKNIPIFIPAFHDSELGNDLLICNWRQRNLDMPEVVVNQEIDSLRLVEIMTGAKKLGIFSIGGGVPRNNMQNGAPLVEIMNIRLGLGLQENKYVYGCRICPDLPYLGHLSGCTYSENASWRKTDIQRGRFSEVMADATMILPFYVAAMQELLEGK